MMCYTLIYMLSTYLFESVCVRVCAACVCVCMCVVLRVLSLDYPIRVRLTYYLETSLFMSSLNSLQGHITTESHHNAHKCHFFHGILECLMVGPWD